MARTRADPKKSRGRDPLPTALTDPRCYGGGVKRVERVETHVSWVFLTGRFAFKVKKPVKLPFVDFRSLAERQRYCREELRVNRRLARDLYVGVVPIGGSRQAPRIGRRPAIEYAVKMREFPSDARLDRQLAADGVPRAALTEFGTELARFHASLPPVRDIDTAEIGAAAVRNVDELAEVLGPRERRKLEPLRAWTVKQAARLEPRFAQRAARGAHRECHGDLHLQNLLWHKGGIRAFDALEFDRTLRCVDVVSEVAFLAMDLVAHRRRDLAYDFMNRYFEVSGDYDALDLLRFYLVHRALVRAKVAAIKRAQGAADGDDQGRYLTTALELTAATKPLLVITHGLSGSGKTTITDGLVGCLPALRARSDVERKRLHGLEAAARTHSALHGGIYAEAATRATYVSLAEVADRILRDGTNAIVDATFLDARTRREFRQVAAVNAARFAILDCTASAAELRRRVAAREHASRDASEADLEVLEQQLRTHEALRPAERRAAVTVDTGGPVSYSELAARLHKA